MLKNSKDILVAVQEHEEKYFKLDKVLPINFLSCLLKNDLDSNSETMGINLLAQQPLFFWFPTFHNILET